MADADDASAKTPRGLWLVLALVFAIYAPSLNNGYAVDAAYLVRATNADGSPNAVMGELHGPAFYFTKNYWAANDVYDGLYRPMAIFSFALTNHVIGQAAVTHHFFDLVLHLLAVFLVVRLLLNLRVHPTAAILTGLLFGAQAIHHEAVVNIVGRSELLSFVCGLGALLLFGRPGVGGKVGSGCLLFVAFCSKESSLAWIAFLPCFELARGWSRERRPWLKPFALVTLPPLILWFVLRENALADMAHIPRQIDYLKNPLEYVETTTRLLTAIKIWGFGLYQSVLPYSLSHLYGAGAFTMVRTMGDAGFLGSLGVLLTLLVTGLVFARRLPLLFLAMAVLLGFGFTASNIPVVVGTNFGERLLYVPSLGICLLAALTLEQFSKHRKLLHIALAIYVAGNIAVVLQRNPLWDKDESLLVNDVLTQPNSANIHDQLAAYLYNVNPADRTQALWHVDKALELYPEYPRALLKRAAYHGARNESSVAKEFYVRCCHSPYILIGARLQVQRALESMLFPKGTNSMTLDDLEKSLQSQGHVAATWVAFLERGLTTPGVQSEALGRALAEAKKRFPGDQLLGLQRGLFAGRDGVADADEARAILADVDPGLWRMQRDYSVPYYVPCRVIAAECHAVLGNSTTSGYIFDDLLADPDLPQQLRTRLAAERTRVLEIGR